MKINSKVTAHHIAKGDKYGLDNCLTADRPMIEFRAIGVRSGEFVISRYYTETLQAHVGGLCLLGYAPEYNLTAAELRHALRGYSLTFERIGGINVEGGVDTYWLAVAGDDGHLLHHQVSIEFSELVQGPGTAQITVQPQRFSTTKFICIAHSRED